uniref:UDENN domain-containing protein n=1 Tax=Amorphochlora amoebiformis TaxID=1561963 RepID=A0A7S0H445_9EUKA|mmetsp:Transcript_2774/g.4193  ORF Transcript_2774/g.4193 Transcript_2774/m.4193 type:complete len:1422 (+) Transcript_2774:147-4412(+)
MVLRQRISQIFRRKKKGDASRSLSPQRSSPKPARRKKTSKSRTRAKSSSVTAMRQSRREANESDIPKVKSRGNSWQSVPGIQAIDLNEFLNADFDDQAVPGETSTSTASNTEQYGQLYKKRAKSRKKKLKAASIGDLDKVFKDPEEFGRYLGVVGAEDQQEVLFICEVEQLLDRVKSLDQKMVANHEAKIGQMYLQPNGSGHYQIKSLNKKIRKKLQESIVSDKTDFDSWRLALMEAKKRLCKESIPAFIEFINRQAKCVTDDEDYKYVFSIHDVFRNPSCACAFFLYMLKDRRHRLLLFWIDLTTDRVGDLRKSLLADGAATVPKDLCLRLEAIYHKYVHSENETLGVFEGCTLDQLLDFRILHREARKSYSELGRGYAERLGKMYARMDKIIRRECWPDFCTSDLYKGAVEQVYDDEKGAKTRKISKGFHKKLKELTALQEMYVAFCRDAEVPREIAMAENSAALLQYVTVLVPDAKDQARYVRRWPIENHSNRPLPSASHIADLCFPRGDRVQELLNHICSLGDDPRLFTSNVKTTFHYHPGPQSDPKLPTDSVSKVPCPWGFDSGSMRLIADCKDTLKTATTTEEEKLDVVHVPITPGMRLFNFVLTVVGGHHMYAACLTFDAPPPSSATIPRPSDEIIDPTTDAANPLTKDPPHPYDPPSPSVMPQNPSLDPPTPLSKTPTKKAREKDQKSLKLSPKKKKTRKNSSNSRTSEPLSPSKRPPPPPGPPLPVEHEIESGYIKSPLPEEETETPKSFAICVLSSLPLHDFLREALKPFQKAVRDIRVQFEAEEKKRETEFTESPKVLLGNKGENEGGESVEEDKDSVLLRVLRSPEMGRLVSMLQKKCHPRTRVIEPPRPPSEARNSKFSPGNSDEKKPIKQPDTDASVETKGDNRYDIQLTPPSLGKVETKGTMEAKNEIPNLRQCLSASIRAPDFSLGPLLSLLHPKRIIVALQHLLMEQKVVLLAHNASTLAAVSAGLRFLLFPFDWRYLYVPVLAPSMFQYLDCPTPYLVGVSAAHRSQVLGMAVVKKEALIVDLENDQVFSENMSSPERLPLPVAAYLVRNISAIRKKYSSRIGNPTPDFLPYASGNSPELSKNLPENSKEGRDKAEAATAAEICMSLGKAWAHMLGGYRRFCSAWIEKNDPGVVFDAPTFLNTKPRYSVPFLREIFKTLGFRYFLESRAMAKSPDGLQPISTHLFDCLENAESHRTYDSQKQISLNVHVVPRPKFSEFQSSLSADPPDEIGQPPILVSRELSKVPEPDEGGGQNSISPARPPDISRSRESEEEFFEAAVSITDSELDPERKSPTSQQGSPGRLKHLKGLPAPSSPPMPGVRIIASPLARNVNSIPRDRKEPPIAEEGQPDNAKYVKIPKNKTEKDEKPDDLEESEGSNLPDPSAERKIRENTKNKTEDAEKPA